MARDAERHRWLIPLPGGGHIGIATLVKRLYDKYFDHAVSSSAATLSFYFLFSLFPFLLLLVTLTGYLPVFSPSMQRILAAANDVLPAQAMKLINNHLAGPAARPRFVILGLAATLYSASRGVDAVRAALNLSYDVKESRPFWKTQPIALGVTIGGALLVLMSAGVAVVGGDAGYWLSQHLGVAGLYVHAWRWARWPVTVVLTMFMAALGYYLLPDVKQQFKFITPGSVIGTLAALAASWGFAVYAEHFGSYDVAYGSIGGVVILMTWFYILGLIYIVGGEINATLEHAALTGKSVGARAAGQKAPPQSERPSAVPVGAAHSADAADRAPGGAA
ncbi:MAG TPA: YihY/virulence factor BrkB family protein [Polyangia bacterium]|nr:YihY/virulence factor BrkB family protein [Polyangia bacterium]